MTNEALNTIAIVGGAAILLLCVASFAVLMAVTIRLQEQDSRLTEAEDRLREVELQQRNQAQGNEEVTRRLREAEDKITNYTNQTK